MALIRAIKAGLKIRGIINYVQRNGNIDSSCMLGINCTPETAIDEMINTKKIFGKENGQQYVHLVLALSADESKSMTPQELLFFGEEIIKERISYEQNYSEKINIKTFYGFETLLVVHQDKDALHGTVDKRRGEDNELLHVHIIVNSVSFETGLKTRWNPNQLKMLQDTLRKKVDEFNKSRNKNILKVPEKQSKCYSIQAKEQLNRSVDNLSKSQSYIAEIADKVLKAKAICTSKIEFMNNLSDNGIEVIWDNRQTILFQLKNSTSRKAHIRNTTLQNALLAAGINEDISKEALESQFIKNCTPITVNMHEISSILIMTYNKVSTFAHELKEKFDETQDKALGTKLNTSILILRTLRSIKGNKDADYSINTKDYKLLCSLVEKGSINEVNLNDIRISVNNIKKAMNPAPANTAVKHTHNAARIRRKRKHNSHENDGR